MPNDILLDENFDLKIANGDFVVDESTYQHQACLLMASKGEYKANPTIGVDSKRFLESERPDEYARTIRQEFVGDGMEVKSIDIADDLQLTIDAIYK